MKRKVKKYLPDLIFVVLANLFLYFIWDERRDFMPYLSIILFPISLLIKEIFPKPIYKNKFVDFVLLITILMIFDIDDSPINLNIGVSLIYLCHHFFYNGEFWDD